MDDSDPWLLASTLLASHGEKSLDIATMQLVALLRLVELKPKAKDVALLRLWRRTAQALLTMFEAKSAGSRSLN